MDDVSILPDPCPLPDKVRKRLDEKQKLIYAPMSDVGGIMYDKDAVYINVPGSFTKKSQIVKSTVGADGSGDEQEPEEEDEEQDYEKGQGERMVMNLQDAPDTLASQLEESELRIFANSTPMRAGDIEEDDDEDMEDEDQKDDSEEESTGKKGKPAFVACVSKATLHSG